MEEVGAIAASGSGRCQSGTEAGAIGNGQEEDKNLLYERNRRKDSVK